MSRKFITPSKLGIKVFIYYGTTLGHERNAFESYLCQKRKFIDCMEAKITNIIELLLHRNKKKTHIYNRFKL